MMHTSTTKNLFVLGDDDFNEAQHLRPLSASYGFNFRCLTRWSESRVESRPVLETWEEARRRLECFSGPIDGLLIFFDFPVSLIAPMLCAEFGLPSPTVAAVLRCEHKLWSRMLQRETIPEAVPAFSWLDPADEPAAVWQRLADEGLETPFWIKPIKGVLGQLAFKIESLDELRRAMAKADAKVDYFAKPFRELLAQIEVEMPADLGREGAERMFLVEENLEVPIGCTAEGYRFDGKTRLHGIVDSFRYAGRSAFHRYQYPSQLPDAVQTRIATICQRVMERFEYEGGAFNIESFWDPQTDRLSLLEINSRVSQSHSPLFQMVDGDSNLKISADLALGRRPHLQSRGGPHRIAAKLMPRVFVEDGTVTMTPGDAEIEAVKQRFPGTLVRPVVEVGQRLSDQVHNDSYSYELAEIYMGARNEEELLSHFNEAVAMLHFEVDGAALEMPSPEEEIWELDAETRP